MTKEEWRPVLGFEGLYEVSNKGDVRSLRSGKIVAKSPHSGGYAMTHLYLDGVRTARTNHRIVAEAFIGPRPGGMEIMHLDGDRRNNDVGNLAYGSHKDNEAAKEEHGTRTRGEASGVAVLTEDDVRSIRARRGEPQKILAAEFGCTYSNISAVQRRKSWTHV